MLSTIVSRHNIVVIINVIFIVFFDCGYELRRLKTSYKRTSSIFTALKYGFLKERDNVTSVLYIFNKANISLILHFFNIIRLGLAWLNVSWQRHLFLYKCFFLYTYFLLT